jgi:hypothetical protein
MDVVPLGAGASDALQVKDRPVLLILSRQAVTREETMNTAKDDEGRAPETIELPAPTAWPMVTALGIALLLGGLVTPAAVSAVGLVLAVIGGIGWWGRSCRRTVSS